MKRSKTAVFLSLLCIAGSGRAWEIPGNPDRFPSFAIGYHSTSSSGEARTYGSIHFADAEYKAGRLDFNLRLPMSPALTVDLDYASNDQKWSDRYSYGGKFSERTDGYEVGGSLRLYLKR